MNAHPLKHPEHTLVKEKQGLYSYVMMETTMHYFGETGSPLYTDRIYN